MEWAQMTSPQMPPHLRKLMDKVAQEECASLSAQTYFLVGAHAMYAEMQPLIEALEFIGDAWPHDMCLPTLMSGMAKCVNSCRACRARQALTKLRGDK